MEYLILGFCALVWLFGADEGFPFGLPGALVAFYILGAMILLAVMKFHRDYAADQAERKRRHRAF